MVVDSGGYSLYHMNDKGLRLANEQRSRKRDESVMANDALESERLKLRLQKAQIKRLEKLEEVIERTLDLTRRLGLTSSELRQLEQEEISVRGFMVQKVCTDIGWMFLFVRRWETVGTRLRNDT